jgi:uncharacterized coiled-coil protein SlyX
MPNENPLAAARAARQAKVASLSESAKASLTEKEKNLRKIRKELKAAKETVKALKESALAAKAEVEKLLS